MWLKNIMFVSLQSSKWNHHNYVIDEFSAERIKLDEYTYVSRFASEEKDTEHRPYTGLLETTSDALQQCEIHPKCREAHARILQRSFSTITYIPSQTINRTPAFFGIWSFSARKPKQTRSPPWLLNNPMSGNA